jgi:integrase
MKISVLYKPTYRPKKNGVDTIRCIIRIAGQSVEITTGIKIPVSDWNKDNETINNELDNKLLIAFKAKINQIISDFRLSSDVFTAQDIKDFYEGKRTFKITLLKAFEDYKDKYEDLEGVKYKSSTVVAWNTIFNRLKDFVLENYSKNLLLSNIPKDFGHRFEVFLLNKLKKSTAKRTVKSIRGFFNDCIEKDYLIKNPLKSIVITDDEDKIRAFLTWDEIQKLIKYQPESKRLEKAKDRFLFCCLTGLSNVDYLNLKAENIKEYQSILFIEGKREKTKVSFRVPLRAEAKKILDKYGVENLPRISTTQHADDVDELAQMLGINKPIRRTHTARFTFAYLCRNIWKVDLANVAIMMGHRNSKITEEIYTYTENDTLNDSLNNDSPE